MCDHYDNYEDTFKTLGERAAATAKRMERPDMRSTHYIRCECGVVHKLPLDPSAVACSCGKPLPECFPEGVKADAGKAPWDLMPFAALAEVVKVLEFGAKKYAPDNWRKVPEAHKRYLAACFRHLCARGLGEKLDPESGLPHLAHAACCVLFLLEMDR